MGVPEMTHVSMVRQTHVKLYSNVTYLLGIC
jgi:hypothetical protein